MLTFTDDNRIGLIDYGQVKRLTVKDRLDLAEIVVAMSDYDRPRVLELANRLGFRTEKNDPDVIYMTCQVSFNRDDPEILGSRITLR
jgi:aarF domain-containing kinase